MTDITKEQAERVDELFQKFWSAAARAAAVLARRAKLGARFTRRNRKKISRVLATEAALGVATEAGSQGVKAAVERAKEHRENAKSRMQRLKERASRKD